MLNIHTCDLLISTEEALRPPDSTTPDGLRYWHTHTLRHRLPMVREALRIAHEGGDIELATYLVDQAMEDHPAAPAPPTRSEAARAWVRNRLKNRESPLHPHPARAWLNSWRRIR